MQSAPNPDVKSVGVSAVLAFLLLLATPLPAPAQPAESPQPPAASEAPAPETIEVAGPPPIPTAEIPARADEAVANVRRIEELLQPAPIVETIRTMVAERSPELIQLRGELAALDPRRTSLRRIEDSRLEWSALLARLEGWVQTVQARWTTLQSEREELQSTQELWQRTREAALAEAAPPEVLQRVDALLQRLSGIDGRIGTRGDTLATTTNRVSVATSVANEALKRLDVLSASVQQRILSRDATPFWQGVSADPAEMLRGAAQARQYWVATLVEFVVARAGRFYLILALLGLSLLVTLSLRFSSRSWPADDASLDDARKVASRPFSTALALTLASMAFILPRSVAPLVDVVAFLAVVPVIRLGVVLTAPPVRPALYGIVAASVLERAWTLAPGGSLLGRVLSLLVTGAVLVGAVPLGRRWRAHASATKNIWWSAALAGLYVATVLLTVSVAANLLGWLTLSQMLAESTIESAYAAIGWLVVARLVIALLKPVPKSGIGRRLPSVDRHELAFHRKVARLVTLVALLMWSRTTLLRFRVLDPLIGWVAAVMSSSITVGGLTLSLGRLVAAVAIFFLTLVTVRIVRFVLQEELLPRLNLAAGADHTVVVLVNYTITAIGVLLAASAAGLTGTQLTVVFGALGVGIGFGLQNVVNNFVSGLILIFERPIKVGDLIEATGRTGVVSQIGIRASMIHTFDGADVVVPNGDLISKEVVNWTLSDQERRVEVRPHTSQDPDPEQVLELLRGVAESHPDVLDSPAPSAFLTGFGENSLEFRLLAWTHGRNALKVTSDLHVQVKQALLRAGIRSPVPQRDLNVHTIAAEPSGAGETGTPGSALPAPRRPSDERQSG